MSAEERASGFGSLRGSQKKHAPGVSPFDLFVVVLDMIASLVALVSCNPLLQSLLCPLLVRTLAMTVLSLVDVGMTLIA